MKCIFSAEPSWPCGFSTFCARNSQPRDLDKSFERQPGAAHARVFGTKGSYVVSLLFAVTGAVATVTLNRPEAMNSVDVPMRPELADLWARIKADHAIRATGVTGA